MFEAGRVSKSPKVYLTAYPYLIEQWHPEKNGDLDPATVTHGSHKKVWWLCGTCDGGWRAIVTNRARGEGCPYCAGKQVLPGVTCLASQRPDLSEEWSPINDRGPGEVTVGSGYIAEWICTSHSHRFTSRVVDRSRGYGCPYCTGKRVMAGFNDLVTTHRDLSASWSPRNVLNPTEVSAGSNKKVLWKCPRDHEWLTTVESRALFNTGCPYCSGKRVIPGKTDLATTHPSLVLEMSDKNSVTGEEISAGSHKKVWWVCAEKGHEWLAEVKSRTSIGAGCPKCCTKRTSKVEAELHRLLSEKFPNAEQGVRVGRWIVDVLLSEERVSVEYDGSYFHKDSLEKDIRKALGLLERGYRIVRIREQSRNYTLPPLGIEDPNYLELTYAYSPDWSGISDVVDQITDWITNLTSTT